MSSSVWCAAGAAVLLSLAAHSQAFAFTPSLQPICLSSSRLTRVGRTEPRRISALKMVDKGGFGGLAADFGGWISRVVKENMGQNDLQKMRAAVQKEDASAVRPDYGFKLAKKLAEVVEQTDIEGAVAAAGKRTAKKVVQKVDGVEVEVDTRFFELSLDRPTGIEFATDLSLKFVYVMEVKDNSPAQLSVTPVEVGDQLVAVNGQECIGQPFGDVATLLANDPSKPLKFRFFRGSKPQLLAAVGMEDYVPTVANIESFQPDKSKAAFQVPAGANLRDSLIDNGVQVYNVAQGRFTNCNGKQLCGTCVVKVIQGGEYTNSKSIDEENFLRKLPSNYRLSCCVNAYGDIIVETRPPTGKKLIEFT